MNRGDVVLVDWPFSDLSGSVTSRGRSCALPSLYKLISSVVDDTIYVKVQGTLMPSRAPRWNLIRSLKRVLAW